MARNAPLVCPACGAWEFDDLVASTAAAPGLYGVFSPCGNEDCRAYTVRVFRAGSVPEPLGLATVHPGGDDPLGDAFARVPGVPRAEAARLAAQMRAYGASAGRAPSRHQRRRRAQLLHGPRGQVGHGT